MSLLPLGIGHLHNSRYSDGIFWLSAHTLFLFLSSNRVNTDQIIDRRYKEDQVLLRSFGAWSIWGFELDSIMPSLYEISPDSAATTNKLLSLFPFGVGQKRNGQVLKGYLFAGLEVAGIAMIIHSLKDDQRNLGWALLGGGFLYGAYDAWYFYDEETYRQRVFAHNDDVGGRLRLAPLIAPNANGTWSLGLAMEIKL